MIALRTHMNNEIEIIGAVLVKVVLSINMDMVFNNEDKVVLNVGKVNF